jgi:dethiobiotin synthetase
MYRFERPVSPHLAARVEGQRIDVVALTSRIRSLAMEDPEVTWLVEGAGGVFSPLAEGDGNGRGAFTHAELVGQVGGRVLLVAPDRLGVLHDVRAAWLALRAALATMRPAAPVADTWSPVLALSAPSSPDGSAGTNAAELRRVFDLDVVACFPRAHYASEESHAAARAVLSAIERIDPWIAA